MNKYNEKIAHIQMPKRIQWLPVSPEGYPVPWFVWWRADNTPDFRVVEPNKVQNAVRHKVCWVCGEPLGRSYAMLLGPMCIINRTISEPPSHRECAVFCAQACPFLSNPRMRRNANDLPENKIDAGGEPILRNPGVVAVWCCREYKPFRAHQGNRGILFTFGDPTEVLWFANGCEATRAEVEASILSGLPTLMGMATQEGVEASVELARQISAAEKYLPAN